MNDARHNIRERERERELEIVDKTQTTDMFRGSSTQLYVPAFTQKDFPYIIHTGLHTQGTSTEDFGQIQLESTQLLSQQMQPLTEVRHKANTISTSQMRDRHKTTQPQSPHT